MKDQFADIPAVRCLFGAVQRHHRVQPVSKEESHIACFSDLNTSTGLAARWRLGLEVAQEGEACPLYGYADLDSGRLDLVAFAAVPIVGDCPIHIL